MVSLSNHGKSYFAETSLHGLKYITEDGRHLVERVLWVVLFFVGVTLMITFMLPGQILLEENIPPIYIFNVFWIKLFRITSNVFILTK